MTLIGIALLVATLIAGATWLALGLCASSAAREQAHARPHRERAHRGQRRAVMGPSVSRRVPDRADVASDGKW